MHDLQDGRRTSKLFMQDEWRPGLFYHVIGKAIPGRTLFRDEEDQRWFVKHVLRFKFWHFFEIIVYCLCGNHFHVVVRTRHEEDICRCLRTKPPKARSPSDALILAGGISYRAYVLSALRGPLSGYARRFNNKYGRSGQLLIRPTLHGLTYKGAPGELFSRRLGAYVGFNFVKHHLAPAGAHYFGSSLTNPLYKSIDMDALLSYYGGPEAYRRYHGSYLRRYGKALRTLPEANYYAALRPRQYNLGTGQWEEGDWRTAAEAELRTLRL